MNPKVIPSSAKAEQLEIFDTIIETWGKAFKMIQELSESSPEFRAKLQEWLDNEGLD